MRHLVNSPSKKDHSHTKKPRFLVSLVLAVTILSTVFGSFSTIAFAEDTNTIAQQHANDPDWLIKSAIYYNTMAFCFSSTHLRDLDPVWPIGRNMGYYIDYGHATQSLEWFAPTLGSNIPTGWYFSPSTGTNSKSTIESEQAATSCSSKTLVGKALAHWGISAAGIPKLLLGMGFVKDGADFNEGNLSKADLAKNFKTYIQTNIYGNTQTPALSDREKYVFWAHSLKNSGILPSIVDKAPDTKDNATDRGFQYVKWVNIGSIDTGTFYYGDGTYSDQSDTTNADVDNYLFGENMGSASFELKSIKYAVEQLNAAATPIINDHLIASAPDKYAFVKTGENIGKIQATGGPWGDTGTLFTNGKGDYPDISQSFAYIFYASKDVANEMYVNTCQAKFNIYRKDDTKYYLFLNTSAGTCDSHQLSAISTSLSLTNHEKQIGVDNLEYADASVPGAPDPEEEATEAPKSCGSQVTGLGWILCPIVDGLTKLNDEVWRVAEKLLTVNPLEQGDTNVYNAWKTIRDLANIAFVIVFLITIFSQVTSMGISNYGIKKLLPRLIVCAILVNVSYILSQVVVDLANIVGSSLYKTLIDMSPTVMPTWGGLLGTILAGTVGATVGTIAIFTSIGGPQAAIWLLVSMALVGLLGVLAAMLTLAFRQAAIPILVIMAPIAIVAKLLPGTEGLFKKWLGLAKPMLLLYPLAALVFGGARFAAGALNDEENWFSQLIALIILALPLFSLPFLAKSSGAITNAFNGAMGKLKDKAGSPIKAWGQERSEASKAAYGDKIAANGPRNMFQRGYQASSYRKMTRKKQAEAGNKRFETGWLNTDQGINATGNLKSAEEESTQATTNADTAWQSRPEVIALKSASKNSEMVNTTIKSEVQEAVEAQVPVEIRMNAKISEDSLKNMTDNIANDLKAASTQQELDRAIRNNPLDVTIPLRQHLVDNQENTNVIASQGASADRVIKQEYLTRLAEDGLFAADASGIDPNGAGRAQEGAITAMNKVWEEDVSAAGSRFARENYEKPELLSVIRTGFLRDGVTRATAEQRNGALKNIVEFGHIPTINNAMDYIMQHPAVPGSATEADDRDLQKSFAEYIAKSSAKEKIVRGSNLSDMFVGKFGINNVASLGRPPRNVQDLATATMIEKNPSPEGYTTMDQDELQLWAESVAVGQVGNTVLRTNHAARDVAIANANTALTDTIIGPKLTAPQRQWLQQYVDNLRLIP